MRVLIYEFEIDTLGRRLMAATRLPCNKNR